MPLFSIIIPAYNRADLLPETFISIKNQTFTDWECIVVDDGSTDNTREVIARLQQQDSRIRYVYQKNAERSAARNKGIQHAHGQYLCFLDSDDAYTTNYLEEMYAFLNEKNFPEALVVSGFCNWDGKNTVAQSIPLPSENIAAWLFEYPVSPSRTCVHRAVTEKYRFREDIVIVEDTVLWVSMANEYPVLYLDKPLVWYRVHEGNSVNKKNNSGMKRLDGLKKFFKDPLSDILPKPLKRKIMSDCYFSIGQFYFYNGEKISAFKYLIISIFTKPRHPQTKAKIFLILCLIPGFQKIWPKKA